MIFKIALSFLPSIFFLLIDGFLSLSPPTVMKLEFDFANCDQSFLTSIYLLPRYNVVYLFNVPRLEMRPTSSSYALPRSLFFLNIQIKILKNAFTGVLTHSKLLLFTLKAQVPGPQHQNSDDYDHHLKKSNHQLESHPH